MLSKNSTMGVENFLRFLRRVIVPAFFIAGFFIFSNSAGAVTFSDDLDHYDQTWYHRGQKLCVGNDWTCASPEPYPTKSAYYWQPGNEAEYDAWYFNLFMYGGASCQSGAHCLSSNSIVGYAGLATYIFPFTAPRGTLSFSFRHVSYDFNAAHFWQIGLNGSSEIAISVDNATRNILCNGESFGYVPDDGWHTVTVLFDNATLKASCLFDGAVGKTDLPLVPFSGVNSLSIQQAGTYPPTQYLMDDFSLSDELAVKISGLGQFKVNGTTPIGEGATTTESAVVFKGKLPSPFGYPVQMQVEARPAGSAFTGIPTSASGFVAPGQAASAIVWNLPNGDYHWRARIVDEQGNVFAWQTMSDPAAAADFVRADVVFAEPISYFDDLDHYDSFWYEENYSLCDGNGCVSPDPYPPLSSNWSGTSAVYNANLFTLRDGASPSRCRSGSHCLFEYGNYGLDASVMYTWRRALPSGSVSFWINHLARLNSGDRIEIGYNGSTEIALWVDQDTREWNCGSASGSYVFGRLEDGDYHKITVSFNNETGKASCQLDDSAIAGELSLAPFVGVNSLRIQQGYGISVYQSGNYIYDDFSLSSDVATVPKRNPVIIVPGIIGSYLNNRITNEELWPNLGGVLKLGNNMYWSKSDSYLDQLILNTNGLQDGDRPIASSSGILSKIDELDFFSGLIQELKNNGYEEGRNVFIFPYDWRFNLNLTVGDSQYVWQATLKQKIVDIKNQTGAEKVDIIAHSMGGLVVKDYIDKVGNEYIDKFIDIATPHFGSPSAFKILNFGDNLGFCDIFLGQNICILNEQEIKKISQNMPSIYQLLPSRKYLESDYFGLNSYIYDIVGGNQNVGILSPLNYDQSMSFLNDQGRNSFLLGYVGINAVNVNDELHSRIDYLPDSDNYYNIIGCGQPTYAGIEKKGEKNWELEPVNGDGTVPFKSAVPFGSHRYFSTSTIHAHIPSTNGVRQLVVSILQGRENDFDFSSYQGLGQDPSICGQIDGTQVGSQSPVELHIYDEYGNHTGPTPDGDMEEGIPGATYDILGHEKYAFLPDGHNYRIINQATSSGELGITIKKIQDSQTVQLVYFNSIKLDSAATNVEYDISDDQTQYEVKVDSNGDGVIDKTLVPDSVLAGEQINDLAAPRTAINISGQLGNNGYYVSDVQLELSAADDNSGILKTEYSLDNGQIWQKYEDEIILSADGDHRMIYRSIDKAGNQEADKEISIKIDQTKPTISILLPQEGQEILRNEKLDVEYFAADEFPGLADETARIYLDGQVINTSEVDLFNKGLGSHQIKIIIQDKAGNQAEQAVNFFIITDIDGAIADVNRVYDEQMIIKIEAKNSLIKNMGEIKNFQEKYGQRIDKEKAMREKAMVQCLKHENQVWCDQKIGARFDRFEYQLNKINQGVIRLKYNLILAKLDLYLRLKWINQAGYTIIKEDIKYLISKI